MFTLAEMVGVQISFEPVSLDDVEAFLSWRYQDRSALYDLSPTDRATFMDPTNNYWAIRQAGELIGPVCVGGEARVPGMAEDRGFVDVGVGLCPDLTGRGASRTLLPAILARLEQRFGKVSFRAVAASWNQRAQRAAEHAGFRATGVHENDRWSYIVFIRQARTTDS